MQIFTPEFATIIASAMAFVLPVTELIKRLFGATGVGAVVISGVVSAIVGAGVGLTQGLPIMSVVILCVGVFATANGWYKAVSKVKL